MTRRVEIIIPIGLAMILAAGGLALSERKSPSAPKASPTWGVFTDAQWNALGGRLSGLGLDQASMQVVTAMPEQDGTPFAIVTGTISTDPLMRRLCEREARRMASEWETWQYRRPRIFKDTEMAEADDADAKRSGHNLNLQLET